MDLVVDASVAIKWVIEEPDSAAAASLARHGLFSPELVFSECGNALWKAAHRGVIAPRIAVERMDALLAMPITIIPASTLATRALEVAILLGHPAYDAFYLAAAEATGTKVVTADRRLLRAVAGTPFSHLAIDLQDAATD